MRWSSLSLLANDREERFPQEALDGLRETGLLGMSIPEEYGGGGGPRQLLRVQRGAVAGRGGRRSIVSVHLGLVAGAIARWGTPEQRAQWLRPWPAQRCSAAPP
ncbi:MAG: acyl-CoA dehydrogenase family protein [Actinomycetota bacterium]|nr:acyl-CoA dehydrogenase family protein [Actinomycetota bacterium]